MDRALGDNGAANGSPKTDFVPFLLVTVPIGFGKLADHPTCEFEVRTTADVQ